MLVWRAATGRRVVAARSGSAMAAADATGLFHSRTLLVGVLETWASVRQIAAASTARPLVLQHRGQWIHIDLGDAIVGERQQHLDARFR